MNSCGDKAIEGGPTDILVMGGSGAGKGIMSAKIVGKFNVNHISTRDIFHSEIGKRTALDMKAKSFIDKGLLAPDEAVSSMVRSYLKKLEDKKSGFLLGDYPETLDQAKAFDALAEGSELTIDRVVAPEIDLEKLADRVTGRCIYKECGEAYHIESKPSKTDNVCDACGRELFQRRDGTVGNLTVCLEECSSQTTPMFGYYDSRGIVTRIDTSQPISSAWNNTLTALGRWKWRKPKQIRS